jgi:flagellar motor component MotA
MLRFIMGILLALCILCLVILIEGGVLITYLAISALLIVLFFPFFIVISTFSIHDIAMAFQDAFSKNRPDLSSRKSVLLWDLYEKATYASGLVGMIMAAISILTSLNEIKNMGNSVAVGLSVVLYSLILGIIMKSLKTRVQSRMG